MGILNVTPDSFADAGRHFDPDKAIARGLELFAEGADIVDVGGESTRPGATPVDTIEELRRVVPVVEGLAGHGRLSIDTRKADVARAAVEAGATLVNDVSASLWPVAAETGAGWIAVHMQGEPATMQQAPHYDDVVGEVRDFLVARAERALADGVDEVFIDPGFGFGKTLRHNLALLGRLDVLVATGFPVAMGISRKATIGRLMAASDAHIRQPHLPGFDGTSLVDEAEHLDPLPVDDRLTGSLAAATWALHQGVALVRVHDVRPTVHAARLVAA
jgi:dihydropteroate synthase